MQATLAVDRHRPPRRERPLDPERAATPAECRAGAWRDGCDCGVFLPPIPTEVPR